jgi:hypothetical protein
MTGPRVASELERTRKNRFGNQAAEAKDSRYAWRSRSIGDLLRTVVSGPGHYVPAGSARREPRVIGALTTPSGFNSGDALRRSSSSTQCRVTKRGSVRVPEGRFVSSGHIADGVLYLLKRAQLTMGEFLTAVFWDLLDREQKVDHSGELERQSTSIARLAVVAHFAVVAHDSHSSLNSLGHYAGVACVR